MCRPCGHIGATWRIRLNLCFLWPAWVPNSNGKSTGQPFVFSSRQKVCILYSGRPFPPKFPLLVGGDLAPSNSWYLGLVRAHSPNGITIGSAVFAQVTAECPILYNGTPLPPQNCPSHGGSGHPFNIKNLKKLLTCCISQSSKTAKIKINAKL